MLRRKEESEIKRLFRRAAARKTEESKGRET
jgi:hypothetical protein